MEEIQKSPYSVELVKMEDLLTESENKTVLKLNKFYFEKGKAVINPEVATELDKVIVAVTKFPELRLKIETHTDSRGSSSSNKRLSKDRSDAIKSYLMKNGLSSNTITESIGYGEEMIRNNCTNGAYCLDFLHQQNERTLIIVAEK
jgi:outer membrane protein OmpA-like peptidoglycan-associated protein